MTLIDDIRFDLSLKNGSLSGALISFFVSLSIFIILPYAVFTLISGGIVNIGTLSDPDAVADGILVWISDIMRYALPLILLSVFIGFYRPGSYVRIPLRIMFALYLGSWLWIASHGGVFSSTTDVSFIADIASSVTFEVDVRYIVYVTLMICFAMIFLAFSEFGGNRKKYFEAIERKKDTMSKRKARRLSG